MKITTTLLKGLEVNERLDRYDRLRGCDKETGISTKEKLIKIEFHDEADDLLPLGYLRH